MTDLREKKKDIKDKIFKYLVLDEKDKNLISEMVDCQQNLDRIDSVITSLITLHLDKSSFLSFLCYQLYKIDNGITSKPFELRLTPGDLKMVNAFKQIKDINNLTSSENADDIRNMFLALSKDVRVVIIKLCGILYDISILKNPLNSESKKFVEQVRDIHIPLSERLGIDYLKLGMDDNLIRLEHPREYFLIKNELDAKFAENSQQLELSKSRIEKILKELKISGTITTRQKHISSIYKKIHLKHTPYNQIYDLVAMRVIVSTIEECYTVLGRIHAMYVPMPGRFKDYIANPKPNGYKSLHTTVVVENRHPMEIQIRTEAMHRESEFGAPAHWLYKENRRQKTEFDRRITFLRKMIEDSKDLPPEEFVEILKSDLYGGVIFVQTPKGRVLEFPEGAIAIDFAYAIHTDIGNSCVGVKINGKIQPITSTLKNGDIVEIITSSHTKGPSRGWINIVKTNNARSEIKKFFKTELKEENIQLGKTLLEEAIKARELSLNQLLTDENIQEVVNKFKMKDIDELYSALGNGNLSVTQVLGNFTTLFNAQKAKEKADNFKLINIKTNKDGVLIDGDSGMLIRFASCCNPIDGDDIIGYISRGRGVTIHRRDCHNVLRFEPERIIEATWPEREETSFLASIKIIADKQEGNLVKFTQFVTGLKIPITGVEAKDVGDIFTAVMAIKVKNRAELNKVISLLSSINGVQSVSRSEGWK